MLRKLKTGLFLSLLSLPAFSAKLTETQCLALNAYHEARNQGAHGMAAVIDVTLNRYESKKYGNTICKVVFQHAQFSWTLQEQRSQFDIQSYQSAYQLAFWMIRGHYRGMTKGALWYHTTEVNPYWNKGKRITLRYKKHVFYS